MQIRNNYDILWKKTDGSAVGTGIFNGDVGTITGIDTGAETLTVYSGIVFPLRRAIRCRAVTGLFQLRTPLLRLAGVSVVVITAPGTRLILPAVPAEQAAALTHALAEEIR